MCSTTRMQTFLPSSWTWSRAANSSPIPEGVARGGTRYKVRPWRLSVEASRCRRVAKKRGAPRRGWIAETGQMHLARGKEAKLLYCVRSQRLVELVCQHRRHLPHRTQTGHVQQFGMHFLQPGFRLLERNFGILGSGDVAGDLGCADQPAVGIENRGNTEGDVQRSAVFVPTCRFVVMNALTAFNPAEDLKHVVSVPRYGEPQDRLPDHFFGGVSKDALGRFVPTSNEAIQSCADNSVIRRFHNGR